MADQKNPSTDPALRRRNLILAVSLAVVAVALYVTFALRWGHH